MKRFLCLLIIVGCHNQTSPVPNETNSVKKGASNEFKLPDDKPSSPLASKTVKDRPLVLEPSVRYDDCHLLFEPGGQPHDTLPFISTLADVIAGCDPEGYRRLDGGFLIAYGTPRIDGTEGRDLRLSRFGLDGKLVWTVSQNRGRNAKNFVANYRGTFIETVSPEHVCTGTMWEGGTQTTCLDFETGKTIWDGRIPAWSGIKPVGKDGGLFVADLTALTKRYPYSGAEMGYKRLAGMGGRAGFYARDNNALYFVPSRSDDSVLYRYDFDTLKESWSTVLPSHPMSIFSHVASNVLVLKIDKTIYGIDTQSGLVQWGYEVGDDRPSVVHQNGVLFVLYRRPSEPNALVAIDMKTGERLYRAETPSGTLQLREVDGSLYLKGVRAIQRITNP